MLASGLRITVTSHGATRNGTAKGAALMDVGHLLYELCTKLGYCLPPDDQARIVAAPPADVDSFTDELLRVEGFDPVPTGINASKFGNSCHVTSIPAIDAAACITAARC